MLPVLEGTFPCLLFLQKSSILVLLMESNGPNLSNNMTVNLSIHVQNQLSAAEKGYWQGT